MKNIQSHINQVPQKDQVFAIFICIYDMYVCIYDFEICKKQDFHNILIYNKLNYINYKYLKIKVMIMN
jgi:hypothetical protein